MNEKKILPPITMRRPSEKSGYSQNVRVPLPVLILQYGTAEYSGL